ncbi:TlpA family protein disulfide reductase [Luteolibacter flavescens]|uniref:TlpA family protein disulfide reductase n=1 Tax=Luteolibacter flavescens TaxID=1859460 RepID=A0ABT3FRA7_9BACT|nr:TlpA disulfide reductase family protein [Luteolibacter flavescens]MCW1886113.1 TlpA family protein disulfide reductase [Luteolibacter flavescens]
MKITYASLFLAAALPAFAQKAGDTMPPDALGKLEWVQGTAPTAWEPGKVYVLECWATWCGPCIAAIPHVDELYDKYQEKGLRVIGVNVWEDGKDKVEAFVKNKGEGMSYPVAYTGKGGVFETEWLKPADVRGIPHAFIVKDGKVLLTTHPMQLTEPVIEGLLAGGDAEAKVLEEIKEAQRKREEVGKANQAFRQASMKKDTAAMDAAFSDLKKLDPANTMLPALEIDLLVAKADWAGAEAALAKLDGNPMAAMTVTSVAQAISKTPDVPESFKKSVISSFATLVEKTGHAMQYQMLAKLQWSLGEKDAAKTSAAKAVEWTKSEKGVKAGIPSAPFEKFAEALDKDELPSDEQMTTWLRESLPKQAKPAAKITPKEG